MKPWWPTSEEDEPWDEVTGLSIGYVHQLTEHPYKRLRKRRFPFGFQAPPQEPSMLEVKPDRPLPRQPARKRKDTHG